MAAKPNLFDQDFCQTFLLQGRAAPANRPWQRVSHPSAECPDGPFGQLAGMTVLKNSKAGGNQAWLWTALPTTTAS